MVMHRANLVVELQLVRALGQLDLAQFCELKVAQLYVFNPVKCLELAGPMFLDLIALCRVRFKNLACGDKTRFSLDTDKHDRSVWHRIRVLNDRQTIRQ